MKIYGETFQVKFCSEQSIDFVHEPKELNMSINPIAPGMYSSTL